MERSPWEILGIPQGSTEKEIKLAYRKLAREFHPDRNSGSSERFIEIQKAYERLLNPEKSDSMTIDIDSIVANFFTVCLSFTPKKAEISVTLEELYRKAEKEVEFISFSACLVCFGQGKRSPTFLCSMCAGFSKFTGENCPLCFGDGIIRQENGTCGFCLGNGKTEKKEIVVLRVSPEVSDGRFRAMEKETLDGKFEKPRYVKILAKEHPIFKRIGNYDLETTVNAKKNKRQKFEIPFLDGKLLKFVVKKEQTQKTKRYKLSGCGLPKEENYGNLYVRVVI